MNPAGGGVSRGGTTAWALALSLVAGGVARADVDWAKGLVTGEGVGIADRHAPSAAVALGTSRRGAEDAARKAIAAQLSALPVAAGGKVGDAANDAAVAARLARAVDEAIVIDAVPETDGAWRVTMAVPIEAVRQAIAGARKLGADGDHGAPVVIVDGAHAKPAVGWTVGGLAGATVFVKEVPAWAKDAPRVHAGAGSAKAGAIASKDLAGATEATLFVIVGG
jgi:hypothetical protein